jgi:hypothetical protein
MPLSAGVRRVSDPSRGGHFSRAPQVVGRRVDVGHRGLDVVAWAVSVEGIQTRSSEGVWPEFKSSWRGILTTDSASRNRASRSPRTACAAVRRTASGLPCGGGVILVTEGRRLHEREAAGGELDRGFNHLQTHRASAVPPGDAEPHEVQDALSAAATVNNGRNCFRRRNSRAAAAQSTSSSSNPSTISSGSKKQTRSGK